MTKTSRKTSRTAKKASGTPKVTSGTAMKVSGTPKKTSGIYKKTSGTSGKPTWQEYWRSQDAWDRPGAGVSVLWLESECLRISESCDVQRSR